MTQLEKVLWKLYSVSTDYFFSVERMMGILSNDGLLFLTRRLLPPPVGLASWWSTINNDENLWLIVWAHPRFILFKTEFSEKEILSVLRKRPTKHTLQRGGQNLTLWWPQPRDRERRIIFKTFYSIWGPPSTLAEEGQGEFKSKSPKTLQLCF